MTTVSLVHGISVEHLNYFGRGVCKDHREQSSQLLKDISKPLLLFT